MDLRPEEDGGGLPRMSSKPARVDLDGPRRPQAAAWRVGWRELSDAREMFRRPLPIIKADPSGELPPFTSDQPPNYAAVLKEFFHAVVPPPGPASPVGPPARQPEDRPRRGSGPRDRPQAREGRPGEPR